MNRSAGPFSKLALPNICRRYHCPFALTHHVGLGELLAPSGKWPQKMTAFDQTLRITLAVALAVSVERYVAPGDSDVTAGNAT